MLPDLLDLLDKEAPDFLAAILSIDIPESGDRLNIPVIMTEAKRFAQKSNQTYLEIFLSEHCFPVDGKMLKFSEFYERFQEFLDPDQISRWSRIKVGREMPGCYPKGRSPQNNHVMLGNIAWAPREPEEPILTKLILQNEQLVHEVTNA